MISSIGGSYACALSPDNFNNIDPALVGITFGGCRITDPAMSVMILKAKTPIEDQAREAWSEIVDYVFDNHCLVGLNNTPAITGGNTRP